MPTYRRPHAIGETISSLLNGTWSDFELLVRDDGDGQDGTKEAVAVAAKGDQRIRYHRNEKQLGMPGNLNAGIAETTGDFIAVCHDHDLFKPSFLETMSATLQRHPTALFVHCAIEAITQDGEHLYEHVGDWPELTPGRMWLKYMLSSLNCPVCALTIVRREAHEHYGLYDSSCGFIADVEMWMRLSSRGDVAYVREPLISVRQREETHRETAAGERWIRMAAKISRQYLASVHDNGDHIIPRLRLEWEFGRKYLSSRTSRLVHRILPAKSLFSV